MIVAFEKQNLNEKTFLFVSRLSLKTDLSVCLIFFVWFFAFFFLNRFCLVLHSIMVSQSTINSQSYDQVCDFYVRIM